MNKFLTLTAEQRRSVFERVGVNVGLPKDISTIWQKDYEVMRSSMIHHSAPTWTELIEQITILQYTVRKKQWG